MARDPRRDLLDRDRDILLRDRDETETTSLIYPNLWAPTAGPLQGLTVIQQCVYQIKYRNVCEVKKRLVQPGLVWSRTLSIHAVNEWRKGLVACVRTVGQRFKQSYCRQKLKNWQLDELSASVRSVNKMYFTRYVNQAIISHWIKSDISLVMFSPGSAETNVGWGGKLNGLLMASCGRNDRAKNYQTLVISFQVTVENVGDVFWDTVYNHYNTTWLQPHDAT